MVNNFNCKVIYQWFNRQNWHPVQISALLTKLELVKLLNQSGYNSYALNLKCDINYDMQAIGKYAENPCK